MAVIPFAPFDVVHGENSFLAIRRAEAREKRLGRLPHGLGAHAGFANGKQIGRRDVQIINALERLRQRRLALRIKPPARRLGLNGLGDE